LVEAGTGKELLYFEIPLRWTPSCKPRPPTLQPPPHR